MKITFELNLRTFLRCVLGLLLVWAALSKLANLNEFYTSILAYRLPGPGILMRLAAISLPWLELLAGLLLIAGLCARAALAWACLLFLAFVLATGQAWARGLDISCGCLNLQWLGLSASSDRHLIELLESVRFAFFRALLLLCGGLYLYCRPSSVEPPGQSSAL